MSNLTPFNRTNNIIPGFGPFHSMFDDFFSNSLFAKNAPPATFKLDVIDAEDGYTINAELPGAAKEEISLMFNEDGRLTISVKKEENVKKDQQNYIHRERRASSMSRNIYLANAKGEDIKAKMDNGILTVHIPKTRKTDKTKAIDIE